MSANSNKTPDKEKEIPEKKIFLDLRSLTAVAILEKIRNIIW